MIVAAACQLGLLLAGIGSDLDFIRLTGFGLGAALVLLATRRPAAGPPGPRAQALSTVSASVSQSAST